MNEKDKFKTELLAPAKDLETAIIAINSGADAVYIGAKSFGARHAACNNLDDIKLLVNYAHKFYVKVHVTINTILNDNELPQAAKLIEDLYNIGVDAIIVQDMGLINLAVQNKLPPIVLHASTQCNNRSLEKVKYLENIGFSRVILARELSLEQIKNICSNTNVEIETFVHGALCVSYSGQCYLSCAIGGRSANKGECAQPCRKKYSLVDGEGNLISDYKHLLSLKDFNTSKYLKELVSYGVKSFKIEGRLKDKNYVKNVVLNYRNELDKISSKVSSGKVFTDFKPDVRKSFNRSFTNYFLTERTNCFNFTSPKMQGEFIGIVKNSNVGWIELDSTTKLNNQDGLCYFLDGKLTGCLVNKIVGNKIYFNKKIKLEKNTKIFRNLDFEFDKELAKSKIVRKISVDFEFSNNTLKVIDEDKNTVEIKINENEQPKNITRMREIFETQLRKTGDSDFYVDSVSIINDPPFIPVAALNEYRRSILDNLMQIRFDNYKKEFQKPLKYAKYLKDEVDYHENIHNSCAKDFYNNCGCQVIENSLESTGNFVDKELMRTKHCLKYAFNMCKSPKSLFLIDEKGKKFKLKFDCKNCEMIILEHQQ